MSVKVIDEGVRNTPADSLLPGGAYMDKEGDLCIVSENGDLFYFGGSASTGTIIRRHGRHEFEPFTPVDLEIKVIRK